MRCVLLKCSGYIWQLYAPVWMPRHCLITLVEYYICLVCRAVKLPVVVPKCVYERYIMFAMFGGRRTKLSIKEVRDPTKKMRVLHIKYGYNSQ